MKKRDQTTDVTIGGAPDKETVITEILVLAEPVRILPHSPFPKLVNRLDQSADDRPFELLKITNPREMDAVPLVAAFTDAYNVLQPAEKRLFNFRLKRGLENIEAGRATSLIPPSEAGYSAHERALANRLRNETLLPPEIFVPGQFQPLNNIRTPHGDGSAGWCVIFPDDAGAAFGHGRSQDGLLFTEKPGEKTDAERRRFRQHLDAARAALLADARARRR